MDASESHTPDHIETAVAQPRSGKGVLAILGALIAVPLLVVVVVLLLRDAGGDSGAAAAEGVRDNRIQSVELTTGNVLFGRLEATSGDWLILRDAFFLRRTTDKSATTADNQQADTELVSIVAQQGGDGDVVLNPAEVVSFQNLAEDSQIGAQIEQATK